MKILEKNDIEMFKSYLDKSESNDFFLDLTSMNMFDSLHFMALSSVYFSNKFPQDKMKCLVSSDDIKMLASNFCVQNLEFV